MDIHRKHFSQLNPRFQQQQQQKRTVITLSQPIQQPFVRPYILPSAPRPQPRQQTRSKPNQERANTAYVKHPDISSAHSNPPYITLANLTKILHVLQTNAKISDSEASIDTNTSTTTTSKQRVQQHLQETAARWWKSIRSSDGQSTILTSSAIPRSDIRHQDSCNPPLLPSSSSIATGNSKRPLVILSTTVNRNPSESDDSESSTEIQSMTEVTKMTQPSHVSSTTKCTRLEPLIMPSHGMRLYTSNYPRYFNNPLHLNYLQHNRLIRQT
ncbi:unnamed protein product [Adineta ricciae]|uniref:Uncharacterized protein n=1 Tax=Adineta ricciae TaxID=249248 RepID=A0A815BM52_ADIRI|nr:unnamed protein product [Adineta ricciae]